MTNFQFKRATTSKKIFFERIFFGVKLKMYIINNIVKINK